MPFSVNWNDCGTIDPLDTSDSKFEISRSFDSVGVLSPIAQSSPLAWSSISMIGDEHEAMHNHEMVLDLVKENARLKAQLDSANGSANRLNLLLEELKEESKRKNSELKQSVQLLQEKLYGVQEMRIKELQNRIVENMNMGTCRVSTEIQKQLANANEKTKKSDKTASELNAKLVEAESIIEEERMQNIHLVEQINCLNEELLQTNNENYSLKKSNVLLTGENLENKNKLKDSKEAMDKVLQELERTRTAYDADRKELSERIERLECEKQKQIIHKA